ncbi:MAG: glycine C-acetyltransferase [Spirochaetaceae bacterium]|nr:glycine C-acetyltransferase [Spirochaetaceae bacterium]MCF7947407.1 glycine C-acetyltransferase [Spirochaetia bacterium]MCF7951328.1 glycine C-acetyltransferase [Spirochaetaceae bacterium]
MYGKTQKSLQDAIEQLKREGLYKNERVLTSPQSGTIEVAGGTRVINFCANNYLGLSNNPGIIKAAQETMEKWGYGLSSVRFICGTQQIHKDLEQKVSWFLGTEDSLLYAACFDANGGVFEPLIGPEDAIISDALNHASIIDGVRLTKSQRFKYSHSDMQELEQALKEADSAPRKIICTDGVFSMDGDIAKLDKICDLADRYGALVLVDDSHATGYIGPGGRGTPAYYGVQDRVDIVTTTFGKALGGASGGCTSGRREIIEMLRQRSRPYLFSNTLAPAVVGGTIKALELVEENPDLPELVLENAEYFKKQMRTAGFDIVPGETAIVPVMLYDEQLALSMSDALLEEGIYVIGFVYPVVPKGKARIRVQLSAAHSREEIDKAVAAFTKVGKDLKVI